VTTTTERQRMYGRVGAYASWARTTDRTARTEPARKAAWERFEKLVDPESIHPPHIRAQMADAARKAHFQRMAIRSAEARRSRKAV
jgi:hypothetical protein